MLAHISNHQIANMLPAMAAYLKSGSNFVACVRSMCDKMSPVLFLPSVCNALLRQSSNRRRSGGLRKGRHLCKAAVRSLGQHYPYRDGRTTQWVYCFEVYLRQLTEVHDLAQSSCLCKPNDDVMVLSLLGKHHHKNTFCVNTVPFFDGCIQSC